MFKERLVGLTPQTAMEAIGYFDKVGTVLSEKMKQETDPDRAYETLGDLLKVTELEIDFLGVSLERKDTK